MARIRTIKPEFWLNESIARLTEHARLLAIALLNHSDDRGYFLASPALVRASCFPFDEHSKNVLGSLQELSSIGYIEIREHDGKPIGRVVKFLDHQRIDKPQKSKLEHLFLQISEENDDSKNIPRIFQEYSKNIPRLEQGTGNREQGKEERERERDFQFAESLEIPEQLNTDEFREAWNDWINWNFSRFGLRLDSLTGQEHLRQCHQWGPEKSVANIRNTMANRSTPGGIWEKRESKPPPSNSNSGSRRKIAHFD